MRRVFTKKRLVVLVIVLLVAVGAMFLFRPKPATYETFTITRGNLTQEVAVTGATKPMENVDLSFERNGTVSAVRTDVGDAVTAGESLVELDTAQLRSQRAEAQANVQAAQARLDELTRGTRPEDIRIAQSALDKANQDLTADFADVTNVLNSAYVLTDDAVRKQVTDLYTGNEDPNPQLSFSTSDSQAKTDTEPLRASASRELNIWNAELKLISTSTSRPALEQALVSGSAHLAVIRTFLNRTADALVGAFGLSATTLATYKTELNTARTNVATALINVTTQAQTIDAQQATVQQAEDQLTLEQAGSTPETIAAQAATVEQAKAQVQTLDVQLAKSFLRSPIAGTVTKQDAKVGELATVGQAIVSVISIGNLEMEANVPEADIAKVTVGDHTIVTLDAYGDKVIFDATVVKIDPAETMVEGVATYKTTFHFDKEDTRVKPGMTANITIQTDKRENVLIAPQRWLVAKDDHVMALVYRNGRTPEERTVTMGLRGSDGNVELLSGLSEGETIVRPTL